MLYTFRSKATADLLMLGPNGDELLRIIGKDVTPKGILVAADMPAAILALEAAIARADAPSRLARSNDANDAKADKEAGGDKGQREDKAPPVGLRQRAWPMVEMMKASSAAGEPITWGV